MLFGVAMLLAGAGRWQNIFGGLTAISLGAFAVSMARDALASGQIRLQYSVIHRVQRPRLFRAAVGLVAAAGLGAVIAGVGLIVDRGLAAP